VQIAKLAISNDQLEMLRRFFLVIGVWLLSGYCLPAGRQGVWLLVIVDGLAKSLKRIFFVIPAQAGIQSFHVVKVLWIPVFTGMTAFMRSLITGI
jgi:hypothetical protein